MPMTASSYRRSIAISLALAALLTATHLTTSARAEVTELGKALYENSGYDPFESLEPVTADGPATCAYEQTGPQFGEPLPEPAETPEHELVEFEEIPVGDQDHAVLFTTGSDGGYLVDGRFGELYGDGHMSLTEVRIRIWGCACTCHDSDPENACDGDCHDEDPG